MVVLTGCTATMVITYLDDVWKITRLDLAHNHELHPPGESRFLRSHKKMTVEETMMIRTCNACKIPTRKIMAILAYMRWGGGGGGLKALSYTKKDVSNVRTSIRTESGINEMMKMLEYFLRKKEKDKMFYYKIDSDEEGRVTNIFWSDGYSRELYKDCGDLVSFDTTYRTNRYNLPFAPIVGITSHGDNCLFGCAFLQNEIAKTFIWLFETLLECMGGKELVSIITDQDAAMRTAIKQVFPRTNHRNCLFHIMKKAQEKAVMTFATTPSLHDDFMDIVHRSVTIAEFERLWTQMTVNYKLEHITYFKIMWANRWRFVPVYFKTCFYPFVQTTARSEGTNAIFKDNVSCTHSVSSFLDEYDRIAEGIEENQKHHDSVTRDTKAKLNSAYFFELQAARLLNRSIFYKFQKQVIHSTRYNVDVTEANRKYSVYKTEKQSRKDFRLRRYVVSVNLPASDYSCICCKFQKDGLLCAHVLRVLVHLNITELDEKYFIDIWRPKEKKIKRNIANNIPVDLTGEDTQMRYNVISKRMTDLASRAVKNNGRYAFLLKEVDNLE
ncbi:hypothetical protein BRADI_1g46084v3 [Brachypodium distachyon]|uniref:Protein FAR1-RELATED SEQUENCE n=1 Tax=Brachypodium distachyon TaxID=15368 RepID=A0A2K2DPM6_BRADI|nr:hypothetical protein BRADI_1g46084v3 [Brachypodium distachyon]